MTLELAIKHILMCKMNWLLRIMNFVDELGKG